MGILDTDWDAVKSSRVVDRTHHGERRSLPQIDHKVVCREGGNQSIDSLISLNKEKRDVVLARIEILLARHNYTEAKRVIDEFALEESKGPLTQITIETQCSDVFSTRVAGFLCADGYMNLGSISKAEIRSLMAIPNMGEVSIQEVCLFLEKAGIPLTFSVRMWLKDRLRRVEEYAVPTVKATRRIAPAPMEVAFEKCTEAIGSNGPMTIKELAGHVGEDVGRLSRYIVKATNRFALTPWRRGQANADRVVSVIKKV